MHVPGALVPHAGIAYAPRPPRRMHEALRCDEATRMRELRDGVRQSLRLLGHTLRFAREDADFAV